MEKTEFRLEELVIDQRYWLDSGKDESGIYKGNGFWMLDKNVVTYSARDNGLAFLTVGLFYSIDT